MKAIILGVVQGATEFLPVSSSGHLTIMQEILGIEENRVLFDVFLHVGTLAAVFMVFGRDVVSLFSSNRAWIPYLAIATVPGAAVGFALSSSVETVFHNVHAIGWLLVVNSLILLAGSAAARRRHKRSTVEMKSALAVGLAQSVAILPGISRAGSTVCSGLLMGWERNVAVRFSFLLGIPIMVGAATLEVVKGRSALGSEGLLWTALIGSAVSAAVGYAALRLFLRALEKGKLWVFAAYSFLLGATVIAYKLAT